MSEKKHSFLPFLLILVIIAGIVFFLYRYEVIPAFNDAVNSIFPGVSVKKNEKLEVSDAALPVYDMMPVADSLSQSDSHEVPSTDFEISIKNPVFCGLYKGNIPVSEDAVSPAEKFIPVIHDGFIKGDGWEYRLQWKLVTDFFSYGDYAAVFTGRPELIIFNRTDGPVYITTAEAYPETILFMDYEKLVFNGRDGNTYYYDFNGNLPSDEVRPSVSVKGLFAPSAAGSKSILLRLRMWQESDIDQLPAISFFETASSKSDYLASKDYSLSDETSIFAYIPSENDKYRIGMAGTGGDWIKCNAVSAVFSSEGELLVSSLDYFSDRPQVDIFLYGGELYYFVCCPFGGMKMPENSVFAVKKSAQ